MPAEAALAAAPLAAPARRFAVAIVTSIHADFDARIWKYARTLAARGHRIELVCPWNVPSGEVRDGVRFHTFARVEARRRRLVDVPRRILPVLRRVLPHVELVHFHDLDLLPWMAAIALVKPVVYDVHENYAEEMLTRPYVPDPLRRPTAFAVRWGQFALALPIRNCILVAESQEPDFDPRIFHRMYVRNYASRELLRSVAPDYRRRAPAVVFSGAQHPNNGSLLLLDIAERLLARAPEVPFYTVDRFISPGFRAHVAGEVERRRLTNVVQLPPVPPHELMTLLNRATIAISPNLRVPQQIKGVHTKLFEYMAAGLPIVASDLPHQVEVVAGNDAGLLARPEDPGSFVDAILRLLRDPELAERLGRNGRRAFETLYSWEPQMPDLERFYAAVLDGGGS